MSSPKACHRVGAFAALCLIVTGLGAIPAAAQGPTLNVAPTQLTGNGPWTVTVTGSRYLVPPHAPGTSVFGGVYLQFGWVRPTGGWGPSFRNAANTDGQFGVTYHYPGEQGDGATRDDGTGTAKFIAFTPGGIDASATDIHMDDSGSWSTTLNILSPLYTWVDPATGGSQTVDCRTVQCGVFTIGAHGKASRTNELFVPVTFASSSASTTPSSGSRPPTGGINQTQVTGGAGGTSGTAANPSIAPRPAGGGVSPPSVPPTTAGSEVPPVTPAEEPPVTGSVPATETTQDTAPPTTDGTDSNRRNERAGASVPIEQERGGGASGLLAAGLVAGVGGLGVAAVVLARRAARRLT